MLDTSFSFLLESFLRGLLEGLELDLANLLLSESSGSASCGNWTALFGLPSALTNLLELNCLLKRGEDFDDCKMEGGRTGDFVEDDVVEGGETGREDAERKAGEGEEGEGEDETPVEEERLFLEGVRFDKKGGVKEEEEVEELARGEVGGDLVEMEGGRSGGTPRAEVGESWRGGRGWELVVLTLSFAGGFPNYLNKVRIRMKTNKIGIRK